MTCVSLSTQSNSIIIRVEYRNRVFVSILPVQSSTTIISITCGSNFYFLMGSSIIRKRIKKVNEKLVASVEVSINRNEVIALLTGSCQKTVSTSAVP